jgi:Uma2 family endonuclease
MFALVSPERIQLPPGAVVRLPATWQDYQSLCEQRGSGSVPWIKYRDGDALLMAPLPQQGRNARLLADIIKALLDYLEQEYDAFTPVTMDLPEESGIEPDYCFYINNWEAVTGKKRINWQSDPPPDLALEVDVTSFTDIQDYVPYRVPEVWLLQDEELAIYQLQGVSYQHNANSLYFPQINLHQVVVDSLRIAYERNTSVAIRQLRQQLANNQY